MAVLRMLPYRIPERLWALHMLGELMRSVRCRRPGLRVAGGVTRGNLRFVLAGLPLGQL
jgi:hypothetical protein